MYTSVNIETAGGLGKPALPTPPTDRPQENRHTTRIQRRYNLHCRSRALPIQVSDITLSYRIVLAPLTRFRADTTNVHTDMGLEYYQQRASVPGTLLITEGTYISGQASGQPNAPGIWNDAQITAWKKVSSWHLSRLKLVFNTLIHWR